MGNEIHQDESIISIGEETTDSADSLERYIFLIQLFLTHINTDTPVTKKVTIAINILYSLNQKIKEIVKNYLKQIFLFS